MKTEWQATELEMTSYAYQSSAIDMHIYVWPLAMERKTLVYDGYYR
jgi:hypothetical protein